MRRGQIVTTWLGLVATLLASGQHLAAAPPGKSPAGLAILKRPATTERKTFDPRNLPSPAPPLSPGDDAVTSWYYSCNGDFGFTPVLERKVRDGMEVAVRIDEATITLGLAITIWLPQTATSKLRLHEEGHRQIAEGVYRGAEAGARRAAAGLIGSVCRGEGPTRQAAINAAIRQALDRFGAVYLQSVNEPTKRLSVIFDELTRHGTNRADQDQALAAAAAQYQREQRMDRAVPNAAEGLPRRHTKTHQEPAL